MQLPSPDPELMGALRSRTGSKLSEEQMAEIIDRVWKRRQGELEEVMKNVQTAAQSMSKLKDKLLDESTRVQERVQTLTDLEWSVMYTWMGGREMTPCRAHTTFRHHPARHRNAFFNAVCGLRTALHPAP